MLNGDKPPVPYKLYTHCLRCGRRLKDLQARQRGYGSKCFEKVQQGNSKKLFANNPKK